eukprot:11212315-Lingulodinium_polyedra.AAC.1
MRPMLERTILMHACNSTIITITITTKSAFPEPLWLNMAPKKKSAPPPAPCDGARTWSSTCSALR